MPKPTIRCVLTASFAVIALLAPTVSPAATPVSVSTILADFIEARQSEFDQIPPNRREELAELAGHVREQLVVGETVKLNFICTHNSRRSHLAQIWASVAANRLGLSSVKTFSGGTESTAMNPRIVETLRRAGFDMTLEPSTEQTSTQQTSTPKTNPRYQVRFAQDAPAITCFSKVYDQDPNPDRNFFAVMVCSDADAKCPVVRGADKRFVIKYDDPKVADDTTKESETYDQRCAQIAREMLYAFSLL